MKLNRRHLIATTLAAGTLYASGAAAQAYPDKPISLVVPYPPGGDSDATARVFAEKLSHRLNQNVIVENKAGKLIKVLNIQAD